MKKKLPEFLASILNLPPAYFYAGLAVVCISLFALSWRAGESDPNVTNGTVTQTQAFDSQPVPLSRVNDLYGKLDESAGGEIRIGKLLNSSIAKLEKLVVEIVTGQSSTSRANVSPLFTASGIDRVNFQPKFADGQISIQRWQASGSSQDFTGQKSFDRLVANVMQPWNRPAQFRVEMKVYSRQRVENFVNARIVVESFGRASDEQGLQATSIWNTTWKINGGELTLNSVQVLAQEEITAQINGGQLLVDCTESVFQRCDTLKNQLIYGLDQWSRLIPNIDIAGNQGIAVGDINQDGLDDLYICQPHGLPNCLLIQNPDGTVEDLSRTSKLDILDQSHAALIIDIDNDGDQDLVISTDENLLLLSNKGNGEFQLEHALPIGRKAHSLSAADFDQDGDLDLFLCKPQAVNRQSDLVMFPRRIDSADDGGRNVLLRNDEGWNFHDATEQCGITTRNNFCSQSAIWFDYDQDGDVDLYVTNEFMTDQFFENQGGWFSEISKQVGLIDAARHRSVSVGDFNQDGRQDLFVATNLPISAYRKITRTADFASSNQPKTKIADLLLGENRIWLTGAPGEKFYPFFLKAPVFFSESAFGTASADLNNDGLDDVIVTNGGLTRFATDDVGDLLYSNVFPENPGNTATSLADQTENTAGDFKKISTITYPDNGSDEQDLSRKISRRAHEISDLVREGYSFQANQRNRCYLGIGRLGFSNFSAISGVDFLDDARAVATTDWDCDGDPDIVMTCRGGPQIRILCNQFESGNDFVHFDLIGTESNVDAIGARVEVYLAGRQAPLVKSLLAGSGNLSQSTKRLMFGLGKSQTIERVDVVWPSGKKQSFDVVAPNARYEIVEGDPKIAEKTNERFKLAIHSRTLHGKKSIPVVAGNSNFYPRPPIPKLQYQTEPGKWFSLEPVDRRPVLALFWQRNSDSEKLIQRLSDASSQLMSSKIDCVAIMADARMGGVSEQLEYARDVANQSEFPFPVGAASESTLDKLRYLAGDWFNHQQLPKLPFAILLDGQGGVGKLYSSDQLKSNDILADIDSIRDPQWKYRMASAPLGGRWTARYRYAKTNRLRTRLNEVGYASDAAALFDKTQSQRAFELCQKAIELDSQGHSIQSRAFFVRSLEMDSNCVPAYVGEGNLLRRLATETAGIKPEVRVQMQLAAAADFKAAISLDPLNTEAIIGRANIAIDQNRLTDALTELMEYAEFDPTRYEIQAIIGRLLFYQGKYKDAASFLVAAFENRPSLPFVAGDLGFLYLKVGQYDRAQEFLQLAHRLQPSDTNILRLLAEAEFVTGRFDEAVKLFERVTKLDPNRRRSKNVLAWLLATCPYENHRNGEQAMKIINPLVDLFGENSPSTLEIYAACFAENGKFEEALKIQQSALDLITNKRTAESYTNEQKQGLRSRLELYRRKRPYRTADVSQTPIEPVGQKR